MEKYITLNGVGKTYRTHKKPEGIRGAVKDLVHREYVYKPAVRDLSFSIAKGEIVGFLGANGAGKTTTLKMLSGMLYPTEGSISVDGFIPTKRQKGFLKKISFIMGSRSEVNWDLPAIDTFRYQQLIYEVSDLEFSKNVNELAERLNVSHLLNTQLRRLSLGERMKMEIINGLLYSPEIVFLDEPTIGLDLISQVEIRKFLKQYNEQRNTTIIITSHQMDDIDETCERIILLSEGSVKVDAPIDQIKGNECSLKNVVLNLMGTEKEQN